VELTDRLPSTGSPWRILYLPPSAALMSLVQIARRMNGEGQIEWTIAASFVDPDGNPFRQRFLLRFDWAIATFEAVEMLVG
jgi:hypothetical protein